MNAVSNFAFKLIKGFYHPEIAVIHTTKAVVKLKPGKKIQA